MNDNNLNNSNDFKMSTNYSTGKYKKGFNKNAVTNSVVLPFLCSALGTSLVIGTCFGIRPIRNTLLGVTHQEVSAIENTSSNTNYNDNVISLSNYNDTAIGVSKKVLPSIVSIEVDYNVSSFFGSSTSQASGSGVIISNDGYILTNNHIINSSSNSSFYQIEEATAVRVYLYNNDTPINAEVIGTDSQTDLAIIKISADNLTAAELGDSDSVQVGEFAMAIGSPLGMKSSVASGIVSALNREITDSSQTTYNLIQTDAAINSGNSGGALVNSKGQVIGINTLKIAATGVESMGFAIPINSCKPIYKDLIQYNKVRRPYIGIAGIDIDEQTAKSKNLNIGIYVKSIDDFSPAQKAGLQVGDIITGIDDVDITNMNELNDQKNKHTIGDTINLKILRNKEEKHITVTLEEQ